jgi:hypothetical protein
MFLLEPKRVRVQSSLGLFYCLNPIKPVRESNISFLLGEDGHNRGQFANLATFYRSALSFSVLNALARSPVPSPRGGEESKARSATHRKAEKERQLADGRWEGKGDERGAKLYELKKAWSSINYSILSVPTPFLLIPKRKI